MKTFCFFDFEADSPDAATARIIEAACVLFSEDGRMLRSQSSVFQSPEVPAEITDITGLTAAHCNTGKQFPQLRPFMGEGFGLPDTILVGHNIIRYDCELVKRLNMGDKLLENRILIDTMFDLPLPPRTTSKKLTHLCSDRGIHTPDAHGAFYDCLYVAKLFFSYSKEERDQVIERAKTPLVYIKAEVNFDNKDKAKKAKFRWDGPQKTWWKQVRLYDREAVKAEVALAGGFPVSVLNNFEPSQEG